MTGFPSVPNGDFRIINARLPICLLDPAEGGQPNSDALVAVSLVVSGGRIRELKTGADMPAADSPPRVDLDQGLVLPVCADLHTHLDKGQTWFRAPNTTGNWRDALEIVGRDRAEKWNAADVEARMEFSLRCAYAHGTAAIRTHIDSFPPQDGISWPVFAKMRDRWAGRIELQGSALVMLDYYMGKEGEALADRVADHGGILGAVVIDERDPWDKLDRFFKLARDRDLDVDFHADETGNPASNGLEAVAEATLRFGWQGRVTAGHCCSLAVRPPDAAQQTIARVAQAGIAVVSLPMCNMYLQDRGEGPVTPRWRGVTLVRELAAAGVPVSVASDNTRDPFYAYGDLDPLEVFAQAVRIAQLDSPIGGWIRAVTATPAAIMSIKGGILREGGPADLILLLARDWSELLSRPRAPRRVIRAGKVLTEELPDYRELDTLRG